MGRERILGVVVLGLSLAGFTAVGCAASEKEDDDTESQNGRINEKGDTSQVLKSVLFLQGGCVGTKVGSKHLLVSARCISTPEGKAMYAAGKTVTFNVASTGLSAEPATEEDAGAPVEEEPEADAGDAGAQSDASAPKDAGPPRGNTSGARSVKINEVKIPPSFAAKCGSNAAACAIGAVSASDAPDLAVLLLEDEVATIPALPVDLDAVGQGDTLLALGSGCEDMTDKRGESNLHASKTKAAPAKVVNHAGSPYKETPQFVSQLGAGYLTTAGVAWEAKAPRMCAEDFGAPVFRGGQAAIVGVLSNATTFGDGKEPATLQYTRVDATHRFKMGTWLKGLGVDTTRSCSEAPGGCKKTEWDGGAPSGPTVPPSSTAPSDGDGGILPPPGDGGKSNDAGKVPTDPPAPTGPQEEQLPESQEENYGSDEDGDDFADAAAGRKKKGSKDEGGCSAAPGSTPTGGLAAAFGIGLALSALRRRRRSA